MQIRWNKKKNKISERVGNHLVDYPTPRNISYYWGFGSLAGLLLIRQLVTGVFLAMHYTPNVRRAFSSVEHIIRDVNYGWRIRYIHANGASFFFIIVYIHVIRGRYYGSYGKPRERLWVSGVVRRFRIILTGFIGYVLPYGQISFWGATVITNLISAVPRVGEERVQWLWGGYAVENPRLNRFYSRHYRRPFGRRGRVRVHLIFLHIEGVGSGNPLGVEGKEERVVFYPYFYVKDRFGRRGRRRRFIYVVNFEPNRRGHPDNYIKANPRLTPVHIVPEWYFLLFYAIRRSIPHKRRGVRGIVGGILIRRRRPRRNTSEIRSSNFRYRYKKVFWLFRFNCLRLGWIGQKVVEYPYVQIGQRSTRFYFAFFRIRRPRVGKREARLIYKKC